MEIRTRQKMKFDITWLDKGYPCQDGRRDRVAKMANQAEAYLVDVLFE